MKKYSILFFLIFTSLLFAQEETKKFILKGGNKISGNVISETDSTITLKTSFGEIIINKKDIKPREVTIILKDGNKVVGEVLKESVSGFVLKSVFGEITVLSDLIDRIIVTDEENLLRGERSASEWYFGKERLVDVFFDPTGYTLEKGVLYISGLTWAYAINDKFDVSSAFIRYLWGDFNIRPKWQIYKSGNIESEKALAVGFHLHTTGPTTKQKYITESGSFKYINYQDKEVVENYSNNRWELVGDYNNFMPWGEIFTGYTISNLKSDKKGRTNYHSGARLTFYPDEEIMLRAWFAVENDITDKLKVLGQIYYDPYEPSYREMMDNTKSNIPFDMDFGFIYAVSENFHLGIHYQPYILMFYYKF